MDGRIVEVIVVSKEVRRLTSARTNKMIQNLGPRLNCGGLSFVVGSLPSTEASLDPRVEADASCCVMVTERMRDRWAKASKGTRKGETWCDWLSGFSCKIEVK